MIALFLVTVALLLGAADWLARTVAQSQLADEIHHQTGSLAQPTVVIGGPVFLPQVLRGRYDQVAITFPELRDGPLILRDVHARLSGVHVPFRDVLTGSVNPLPVDHADEQALLTYDDLNSYLAAVGQSVTVQRRHDDGTVLLTGSIRLGASTVTGTAEARISAAGDAVAVTPTRLISNNPLASLSQVLLGERFTFLIPLDPLPFGEQVTDIQVQEQGLLIRAHGDSLLVTP
ncbi:LmeA family phospholipid-binding protein [Nakamurella sp. GG22]